MRNVSEEFLKATKLPTREIKCRARFEIIEDGVRDKVSSIEVSSSYSGTDKAQVCDGIRDMKYNVFTYENNRTRLDGTFKVAPDNFDNSQIGWWSSGISNINNAINESITINLSSSIDLPGIGIVFDRDADTYATNFKLTIGTEVINVTNNNSSFYRIIKPVDSVSTIKVEFTKLNKPNNRLRVTEIDLGLVEEYTDTEIIKAEIVEEISYNNENLPTNTLSLTIDNQDNRFDPINPQGIYSFLKENQKMYIEFGMRLEDKSIEWVDMGTYFLDTPQLDEGGMTATFKCKDFASVLEGITDRTFQPNEMKFTAFKNKHFRYKNGAINVIYKHNDTSYKNKVDYNFNLPTFNDAEEVMNLKDIIHTTSLSTNILMKPKMIENTANIEMTSLNDEEQTGYVIDLDNENEFPKIEELPKISDVTLVGYKNNSASQQQSMIYNMTFYDDRYTVFDVTEDKNYLNRPILAECTGDNYTIKRYIYYYNTDGSEKLDENYEGYRTSKKLYIKRKYGKGSETLPYMMRIKGEIYKTPSETLAINPIVESGTSKKIDLQLWYTGSVTIDDSEYKNNVLTYHLTQPTHKIVANWRGNPALECGDRIKIEDKYHTLHDVIITKQTLTYTGGLTSNIEAAVKRKGYNIKCYAHYSNMEEKNFISKELGGVPLYGGYYLRGISINIDNYDFEYMCRIGGDNTSWSKGGSYLGVNTDTARIEGIAIRNTIVSPKNYKIQYRVYIYSKGWTNWTENGTYCGTQEGKALMAVEVKVVKE